jgi:hypothetical protein
MAMSRPRLVAATALTAFATPGAWQKSSAARGSISRPTLCGERHATTQLDSGSLPGWLSTRYWLIAAALG